MTDNKADKNIEKPFESLLNRYQTRLEISMRDNVFAFDCIHLLYYECHEINFKRVGSYIDSLDWIKAKKAAINPLNKKHNKCFQYYNGRIKS